MKILEEIMLCLHLQNRILNTVDYMDLMYQILEEIEEQVLVLVKFVLTNMVEK